MDVVVVGAVNVDFVVQSDRLPGPGETVVGAGVVRNGGGKGANAAVAAARAGARVRLVGAVGADPTGSEALAELQAEGIDTGHVAVLPGQPTGVALIVVDGAGENQIAVGAGANHALTAAHVTDAMSDLLGGSGPLPGCVLVSTEIPVAAVAAAVRAASHAGVTCVLNPAPVVPGLEELLQFAPVLTPNRTEAQDLADLLGSPVGPGDDAHPVAVDLAARTGSPVVVTLGGDGALVVADDAERIPPGYAIVRDTTGAGDTFNGVLATRLAAGNSIQIAARYAVAAGALSVGALGARAGMPTADAIAAALHRS